MGKWNSEKLKDIGYTFTGLSGKKSADFGEGSPYIPYMNIFQNTVIDVNYMEYVRIDIHEKQNKVRTGDVFFTTSSETPDEVGMSSVLVEDIENTYLNSFCFGYRVNKSELFDKVFFAYLLRDTAFRNQMKIAAQGSTRFNLSKTNFGKMQIQFPENIKEQQKIADILSEVDIVIDKTKKLIDKYKCVKEGLLQDLLTNGIDEKGIKRSPQKHEYKDSPLGMIPKEWSCMELKELVTVCQGLQIPISERYTENFQGHMYQYITVDYLNNGNNEYYVKKQKDSVHCSIKDILMTRTGDTGTVITNVVGVFHNNFFKVIYDQNKIIKDFLYLYLNRNHIKEFFKKISGTTTIPDLKHKDFLTKKVAVPLENLMKEQERIVVIISSIDNKIQTEEKYLNKILNIKKGLMQDLLNQKVSVDSLL